ncbi:MAG: NifU family protein [Acidobacteria bacterium]|nr:NifU family protein [Acidobacteriota bacterium]
MDDFDARVRAVIEQVRPFLQRDGGEVELVAIIGRSAKVRLTGHCAHCAGARMTLKYGIERQLKEQIPEFESLISI